MIERGWVLIVEDDPGVADVLVGLLEGLGYDCHWAKSDIDAQNTIASRPAPAALVLDVNLGPGTTGFEVARFGRQRHPDVPVIYTTGAVPEDSFKAFGVPHSFFLPKPFFYEEFKLVLEVAVAGLTEEADSGARAAHHSPDTPSTALT
jgi:CheY-like chemotaxis protein